MDLLSELVHYLLGTSLKEDIATRQPPGEVGPDKSHDGPAMLGALNTTSTVFRSNVRR